MLSWEKKSTGVQYWTKIYKNEHKTYKRGQKIHKLNNKNINNVYIKNAFWTLVKLGKEWTKSGSSFSTRK